MDSTTDWFGDDGQWGAVYIAVGDDPQAFVVLPNTAGVDILAVDGSGCDDVDTSDCSSQRGGLFESDNSTTWKPYGFREASFNGIGLATLYADYGSDYVTFNFNVDEDTGPSNISSSVGTFNSTVSWIGSFGLGLYRSELSNLSLPTFMESIWDNRSAAPSCSYGYTAGAYYRLKGVPASLTIGGFDQLRFEPNPVSFNLSFQGWPVVSLSSIEVLSIDKDDNSTTISLLEASIDSYFTLDSSTSYIWLPGATCDEFSQALNLTYNETLALYTYPDGVHDYLASSNVSFTFAITDTSTSLDSVNITLPFSALDQYITYPYPNFYPPEISQSLPYFPIRRASSSNEYRIGRVFFQEAYLVVDYERNNFSVYQATFDDSVITDTNIIIIEPPPGSLYPGENSTEGLSQGSRAGIVVGSLVGFMLIIALIWWFFLRNRYQLSVRRREPKPKDSKDDISANQGLSIVPRRWLNWRHRTHIELEGDNTQPSELPATRFVHELPGSIPGTTDQHPSTPVPKQNLRRSAISTAASSTVSLSSAARMSESSDGSFDEEELVSPRPNSRPSSIAKHHFPTTNETAETNHGNEDENNNGSETESKADQRTRTQPGEIVLGPSASTYTSKRRSDDQFSS
ncbi:hypothetical protein PISL3812_06023 [Talaromyces islandicus]|uniref:Peptidase A1 domain-containing protein n=1 Tax=Talaromyces islandicus TaxID=28573 RepID=A0A0U1M0B4_TALIS|nr:hypothetical protein PISL3812_06023 [Talaromyces islandicus]